MWLSSLHRFLPPSHLLEPPPHTSSISITKDQVRRELADSILPRRGAQMTTVLKLCASHLTEVLLRIFNLSLSIKKVPVLGKLCVWFLYRRRYIPVPHRTTITLASHCMMDRYRTVAMYVLVIASFEVYVCGHYIKATVKK